MTITDPVLMTKPDLPVAPPDRTDYDIAERVVRALQDSPLHVFTLNCLAGCPDRPGTDWCIVLTLAAITDGRRGFLVLTDDFAPPRTDAELAEFMEGLPGKSGDSDYASRPAIMRRDDPRSPEALDLCDPQTARAAIEAAYEAAFAGAAPVDHAAFFARFAELNVSPNDESSERQRCRDLDGFLPPANAARREKNQAKRARKARRRRAKTKKGARRTKKAPANRARRP